MKMTLLKSLFVALVLLTNHSYAFTAKPSIRVVSAEKKLIAFAFSNLERSTNRFVIKDEKGVVFYAEEIKENSNSKKYDLNSLELGNYQIELYSEIQIKNIPFRVTQNGIEFKPESVVFIPVVRQEGAKLYINQLALNNESLKVSMYDDNSNLLYQDKFEGKRTLGTKLNLERLEKGTYRLYMKSSGKEFSETIVVK